MGELPEANKEYVFHMRKKTPEDLIFRGAIATLFAHLGIRFQSFRGIFFHMGIQMHNQVILPATCLIYSSLNVDVIASGY